MKYLFKLPKIMKGLSYNHAIYSKTLILRKNHRLFKSNLKIKAAIRSMALLLINSKAFIKTHICGFRISRAIKR